MPRAAPSRLMAPVALVVAALLLAGCSSESSAAGEHEAPATVTEVDGSDVKQVTFTSDAASRVGLESAATRLDGAGTVVPYASLIFDGHGVPWVYEISDELTFQRTPVVIDRIEGDTVWLSEGPRPGTRVVTVGATEVYGAELEIGGGH